MDQGLGDEVAPLGAGEGVCFQRKESEYSLKPESRDMLGPREMFIPVEGDYSQDPAEEFAAQEGKILYRSVDNVNGSEQPHASSGVLDDAGVMVEELRVTKYNGSNLAIVGTSNYRERMQFKQSQWQHLYKLAGGLGGGSSRGETMYRDNSQTLSSFWEDMDCTPLAELSVQKPCADDHNDMTEQLTIAEMKGALGNNHGGIRTKILSKSGFSEFFVKQTLKGKGIICKGPPRDGFPAESKDQNNLKVASSTVAASDISPSLAPKTVMPSTDVIAALPSPDGISGPQTGGSDHDGVSLRQWLKVECQKASKFERLYIFRQIVNVVDYYHSQGTALKDLRPSCFRLLPSNKVKFVGSPVCREMLESAMDQNTLQSDSFHVRKRPMKQKMLPPAASYAKKLKFSENKNFIGQWHQYPSMPGYKCETAYDSNANITCHRDSCTEYNEDNPTTQFETQGKSSSSSHFTSSIAQQQFASIGDQLEEKWYTSPEEPSEGGCTISSNIYCLGVVLFELLGRFDSEKTHAAAMSDLRFRILPPEFLSENTKEAGFCLWLLHPKPSSRPTTREILQSEMTNGAEEVSAEELSSSMDQDDAESDLLLHFLVLLDEHKQKDASKLVEEIRCLEIDIEEVERRHYKKTPLSQVCLHNDSLSRKENKFLHKEPSSLEVLSQSSPVSNTNDLGLTRNISHLESVYFSMRSKVQLSESDATARADKDLLRKRENWYLAQKDEEKLISIDPLGDFFDGLCKYARYSKFEVRGILRNGDFSSSANVICSLSFDRDEDYFAAAGVSKKIKIFEFNALFNESVDIHYPVIEISNKSRLSCVCWNNYIRNYLASTDYDGVVKLWDASTGQVFSQFTEHSKRAWSVDFSQACPTKLASGSDDYSVKLWSITERNCLDTIRTIANVCCVQFSPHSSHLLAFGSSDYRTYCYDLRNTRTPWCVLAGHDKAVSYAKFLDTETLVSASTDNTLKLWDLKKSSPSGPSTHACNILTLSGHTNEKNFVGLSTANGYIACGSETNEVYAYHRSLYMPITSHKFGSIDPISGKETDDDNGQFVSSVCWRGKSDMVVAASSSGCIKVLQLV